MTSDVKFLNDFLTNNRNINKITITYFLYHQLVSDKTTCALLQFAKQPAIVVYLGVDIYVDLTLFSSITVWENNSWSIPIPYSYLSNYKKYLKLQVFA